MEAGLKNNGNEGAREPREEGDSVGSRGQKLGYIYIFRPIWMLLSTRQQSDRHIEVLAVARKLNVTLTDIIVACL